MAVLKILILMILSERAVGEFVFTGSLRKASRRIVTESILV